MRMAMSVSVATAMSLVTMASSASRSTSAQPHRQICIQSAPVSAVHAMTFLAPPAMSEYSATTINVGIVIVTVIE